MLSLQSDLKIQQIIDSVREQGFYIQDDLGSEVRDNVIKLDALGLYELLDGQGNELVRRVIGLRQNEYNAIRPIYLTDKEYPRLSKVACGPLLFMFGDVEQSVAKFNQKPIKLGQQRLTILACA